MASWSSALTNVLITLALVSGAMSAAILGLAALGRGVLAMVPGTAMALQGKLFEEQSNHHRIREVAYHGLLDELVYEGAVSISRRRRQFRERSESDRQKANASSSADAPTAAGRSRAAVHLERGRPSQRAMRPVAVVPIEEKDHGIHIPPERHRGEGSA